MATGVRRVLLFIAVLAAAAIFVPTGFAGTKQTTYPTLFVKYTMNCTFTIENGSGARVNSIPSGTYMLEVSTPVMFKLVRPGGEGVDHMEPGDTTGCRGWVQFQLTGSGVDVFTTLDTGCDAFLLIGPLTFKAGSTYTAQEMLLPAATRTTFSVTSDKVSDPTNLYTWDNKVDTSIRDIVGSLTKQAAHRIAFTLTGNVTPNGTFTLRNKGNQVAKLRPGKYALKVFDKDPKRGFILRKRGQSANVITSASWVGPKSVSVTLTAGEWLFYSGRGKVHSFRVT